MGRRIRWLLVLAGGVGMFGFAQNQNSAPPAGDKPATVEGTVTNALTGEPLIHAHVSLRGMVSGERRSFGAVTTAEGKFTISNVPAGAYMATAERVGFTLSNDRAARYGVQLVVRSGDRKDDLKLKLTPTGALSGRVVDADGEPVEGVSVSAEIGPMGMRQSATTDDKGQFRVGGLAPGKYRVKASPMNMSLPPEIRTDGTVEAHYVQTYFPNSLTEKGAGRVEVQAGAEVGGIGIQLVRAPIVGVSGTVVGLPSATDRVMIEIQQGWGTRSSGIVREDGTFQIWRLDPGKYTISASWNTNGQRLRTAPVDIEVAESNIDHVELRAAPPLDIAGQVEFEDEQAKGPPQQQQPQARQQATPPQAPPRRLYMRAVGGMPSQQPAEIGEDGSFRMEGVLPGRYRVTPSWRGAYVKSMRLGQTAIEGNLLDLSNGSAGARLSVLMSAATAEISGIVRDDKGPVAGISVALLMADAEPYSFPTLAKTGEDGAYNLSAVAPGKYKLAAVEDNDIQSLGAADTDGEDAVELVEIRTGDKITKDLKQRPAGK